MKKICVKVQEAIQSALAELEIEIVEIKYEKAKSDEEVSTLWVYIYHVDGVDLDLLEKVSRIIDPILDEIDPTNGETYNLNVSSPGLDRPFKTDRDFERNIGKDVEVKLYSKLNGKKEYTGKLKSFDKKTVFVELEDDELCLDREKIAKMNLAIKFN